ncbi:MAG: hypothetical protein WC866_00040 [Patescibacteria group bacterium]
MSSTKTVRSPSSPGTGKKGAGARKPTKSQTTQRLYRESGIRLGSIIRRKDGNLNLLVLIVVKSNVSWAREISGGPSKRFSTCLRSPNQPPTLNMTLVFAPPDGWTHAFAVQPNNVVERGGDFTKLRDRLQAFMRKHLTPDERQTLEYGEYWRNDAIKRLREQFEASESANL